jgi:hypothetical protein
MSQLRQGLLDDALRLRGLYLEVHGQLFVGERETGIYLP